MSTYNLGTLIDFVEKQALDEGNVDNTEAEWIGIYNITLRDIIQLDKRANAVTESLKLASGSYQACAATDLALLDIVRNMGTDGATAGASIREVPLDVMKAAVPSWSTETVAATIEHFMRDPDSSTNFYVYPPSDGTGYIEKRTSQLPSTATYDADDVWKTATIGLADNYLPAIINGMLARAFDEDSDIPGNEAKSEKYRNRMIQVLGLEVSGDQADKAEMEAKWRRT